MAGKISFSFSKVKKSNLVSKAPVVEKKDVQYVDSFDGAIGKFSFQGAVRIDEEVKKELVIPLVGSKSAYDVIKEKLNSQDANPAKQETNSYVVNPIDNQDASTGSQHLDDKSENIKNVDENDKKGLDVKPSLEFLAAQEILAEARSGDAITQKPGRGMVIVADGEKPNLEGEKESTLDDYEDVPVDEYGLAMLRGMGWKPLVGIGKESKVIEPMASVARPKRLGLGADPAMFGVVASLKRGSFVKIISGPLSNEFGIVEGLDGDVGSVFVKIDGGGTASVSDNVVRIVSKEEYDKKSSGTVPIKKENNEEQTYGLAAIIMKRDTDIKKERISRSPEIKREEKSSQGSSRHSRRDVDKSKKKKRKKNHRSSSSPDSRRSKSGSSDSETQRRAKKKKRKERSNSPSNNEKQRKKKRDSREREKRGRRSSERDSYRKKTSKRDRSKSRSRDRGYKKQKSRRRSRSNSSDS